MDSVFKEAKAWQALYEELLSWVGTPYAWLQKTKKKGTDCSSFIVQAFLNVGLLRGFDWPKSHPRHWFANPEDNFIYTQMKEGFEKYSPAGMKYEFLLINVFDSDDLWTDYQRGDILLFKIRNSIKVFNHSTILSHDNKMFHLVENSKLTQIEFKDNWRKNCKGMFRLCWDWR